MKFQIETNCWARFKAFIGRRTRREVCILSAELTLVLFFIGAAYLFGVFKPILRDFVISNVAHVNAGSPIPFEPGEPGYTHQARIDPNSMYSWGLDSNSKWVADYVRMIVPFMYYEGVSSMGYYPDIAGIAPFKDKDSFHVGGRMKPEYNAILLNERYFIDERWNDKRRALGTLVHELVHVQGGAYLKGTSAELEAATQSATIEVLADICNYGDSLACKTFW